MFQDLRSRGFLFIALGIIIFVSFAGQLLLQLLAIILAVFMINHGLKYLGRPPLFVLMQQWFDDISYR